MSGQRKRILVMHANGATAVVSTSPNEFLVSIKGEGIYSFKHNRWKLIIPLQDSIYQLKKIGDYIMGVGERGRFIRLHERTGRWKTSFFPTSQRLWNIVGNDSGLVITHAGTQLLVSSDFGVNWKVISLFKELSVRPIIRSLTIHDEDLYIGTQIHKQNGGLWKYTLSSQQLVPVLHDEETMVSSIHVDNSFLWLTTGACQTKKGTFAFRNHRDNKWHSLTCEIEERAFLGMVHFGEHIYVCSSKDEYGYSRIYHGDLSQMTLEPVETIKGHCFCIAASAEDLFLAGGEECKWMKASLKETKILH
ncbi:hypothetical protein [Niallia taxi]|uniref:hypothetical protein n=1 Tax=Niallia taxi TaxID=2499688 RepID=UPI002E1B46FA|nr:hypothetical protein [Niallia taxi]